MGEPTSSIVFHMLGRYCSTGEGFCKSRHQCSRLLQYALLIVLTSSFGFGEVRACIMCCDAVFEHSIFSGKADFFESRCKPYSNPNPKPISNPPETSTKPPHPNASLNEANPIPTAHSLNQLQPTNPNTHHKPALNHPSKPAPTHTNPKPAEINPKPTPKLALNKPGTHPEPRAYANLEPTLNPA